MDKILYKASDAVKKLGHNIDIARKRRRLSMRKLSELAMISESTLRRIVRGESCVRMGTVASVLCMLSLEKDLVRVADPLKDEIGLIHELRRLPKKIVDKPDDRFDF